MVAANSPSKRLVSLDALRGFTIAGMIMVNVPGSWSHIYPLLRHAEFNGLTLADLVFPFFLFIVGASIVLALGKRIENGVAKSKMIKKVIYRTMIIFLLGVILNWLSDNFTLPLRLAGVLQRIALCYLVGSLLYIYASKVKMIVVGTILLVSYWLLIVFIPVPGEGGIVFTREMNWAAWVDGQWLPGKMYFGTWDPEGILSTFPAIVNTLLGIFATILITKSDDHLKKVKGLLIFGSALLMAGLLLSTSFPINKNVWSSSFVLVTSGLASILWSILIYLVDIKSHKKLAMPGVIFGSNAITAYVLHYLFHYPFEAIKFGGISIQQHFMTFFSGFISDNLASFFWAIFYTFFCFLPVWWMYHKKVFLKI